MDLKHIIDQKDHYADYMVDEITHICRDFEKREPGSKGEQQACEYMAQVLKKDCGCQRAGEPRLVLWLDLLYHHLCVGGHCLLFLLPTIVCGADCCGFVHCIYAVWSVQKAD